MEISKENFIKSRLELIIDKLEVLINECEKENVTNEQWFIDIEDKLNELSIKDHSIKN